jgi:hypothetical protein
MPGKSKRQPQTTTAESEPNPAPALIVFGLDQANKPRAASFTPKQVELATKAADLMKLHVLKVEGPELTELAARLQPGRIYASGHGFVPPIRPQLYERLNELADPKPAPGLPRSWDDIEVGHLVLVTEAPGEGYWEALVLGRDKDMLTVKWRDWPTYPQLVCHRASVALLKPTAADQSASA